jgi:hypothetical protein
VPLPDAGDAEDGLGPDGLRSDEARPESVFRPVEIPHAADGLAGRRLRTVPDRDAVLDELATAAVRLPGRVAVPDDPTTRTPERGHSSTNPPVGPSGGTLSSQARSVDRGSTNGPGIRHPLRPGPDPPGPTRETARAAPGRAGVARGTEKSRARTGTTRPGGRPVRSGPMTGDRGAFPDVVRPAGFGRRRRGSRAPGSRRPRHRPASRRPPPQSPPGADPGAETDARSRPGTLKEASPTDGLFPFQPGRDCARFS